MKCTTAVINDRLNTTKRERFILHCDCNSFYASVETAQDRRLASVPMAVCGDPAQRHGIILAKNALAASAGVTTGEPLWQAKRKCPSLVTVLPRFSLYSEYSERVNDIYRRFTDLIEPFGIDESWLDVTESRNLFGDGKMIADRLRELVRNEVGITISVGVSFNKAFAKLGSDMKKPDATTVIKREDFRRIVWPLAASSLLFVGPKTERTLREMGVYTIGDIVRLGEKALVSRFGARGRELFCLANGQSSETVAPDGFERTPKSVGCGLTFDHDLTEPREISAAVYALSDRVATRLRTKHLSVSGVKLSVRTADFLTRTKQRLVELPSSGKSIAPEILALLPLCGIGRAPIRALTVTAMVSDTEDCRISLFDDVSKINALEKAIDDIRGRFGKNSIFPASTLFSCTPQNGNREFETVSDREDFRLP